MPDRLERYLGCLLGLATGDAVGTTLEFRQPGTFAPIDDMVGGGPFRLQPGEWTDDTAMALCLADSLVRKQTFDPQDQMERYCRWENEGYLSSNGLCFDIGTTVQRALSLFRVSGNPFSGSVDSWTAGNGSLMRLAPVPMFFYGDARLCLAAAAESSRVTHGARTCLDACRYFGGLLWAALHGTAKERLLSPTDSPVEHLWRDEPLCAEISEIAAGSFQQKNPPEIRGSGYVVRSLEAALWAFFQTDDFRSGCLLAANLGDDADTTAAIYGQLAGAVYGRQGIPTEWLDRLAHRSLIEGFSRRLWSVSQIV